MKTINWKRSSLTGLLLLLVGTLTQAQQISSNDNRQVEKIHKEVFYDIRQSDNDLRSTALREVAEFIKKHEDAVINVVGYADKGTGTSEQNKMYAKQRAENFKADLVKQFNVDGSRIITDSKGDTVQPFAENNKNRCVIIDGFGYIAKPVVKAVPEQRANDYADQQRRQYQEDRDRRYAAAMGRVDTVFVERVDTVWILPPVDSLHPETPFGLNKCHRWRNWFVQAGVGPAIFQGDHNEDAKWSDRLYTTVNVSVGKWFYPALGVRAGVDLDIVRMMYNGAPTYHYDGPYTKRPWLNKMAFNTWNFRADALFNLTSLFWRPYQKRIVNIIPYAGLGVIATWDEPFKSSLSLNAGVLASVRLAERVDLNFDLRLKEFDDDLNWYEQGRSRDGITNLTVGLTWHFTERGF